MGHYLECFGTLWDIFHANRFFSSLGQFPGQYFSFRDTFLSIFVQNSYVFLPRERRFLISILGVFYLPLPQTPNGVLGIYDRRTTPSHIFVRQTIISSTHGQNTGERLEKNTSRPTCQRAPCNSFLSI